MNTAVYDRYSEEEEEKLSPPMQAALWIGGGVALLGLGYLLLRPKTAAAASVPTPPLAAPGKSLITTPQQVTQAKQYLAAWSAVPDSGDNGQYAPSTVNTDPNEPTFVAGLARFQKWANAQGDLHKAPGVMSSSIRTDGVLDQDTFFVLQAVAAEAVYVPPTPSGGTTPPGATSSTLQLIPGVQSTQLAPGSLLTLTLPGGAQWQGQGPAPTPALFSSGNVTGVAVPYVGSGQAQFIYNGNGAGIQAYWYDINNTPQSTSVAISG